MNNLEGKSLVELKEILKSLKLYKDLKDKLWNRGKALFQSLIEKKSLYKVEYFEKLWEKNALEEAQKIYEKIFSKKVWVDEIILKSKDTLEWWIRVFLDDNLVDLSFNRIEKKLK